MAKLVLFRVIIVVGAAMLAFYPHFTATADCQVNGGAGVTGTAGADNITCDNNPAAPAATTYVGGQAGQDTIVIEAGTTVDSVAGDDNGGVVVISYRPPADGENDQITIHGTVQGAVDGDMANNRNGGADTITVSNTGQVGGSVIGDRVNAASTGGADVIQVDGTSGDVFGDRTSIIGAADSQQGGNDQITINGTSGAVYGDDLFVNNGTATGGYDTIIIGANATTGDITGERLTVFGAGTRVGGNDQVTINVGATVGTISGGDPSGDTDTLTFAGSLTVTTFERDAIVAYLVNANAASGSIALGGKNYTWVNFEILGHTIVFTINDPVTGQAGVLVVGSPPPLAPASAVCFDGVSNGVAVKCFVADGFVQVYAGFDLFPNGFLVTVFSRAAALPGEVYGNDDPNTPNWSVRIIPGGMFNILDENGNPIGGNVPY